MMNPFQERKRWKRQKKKPKSDQDDADPSEYGRNYGLDRLNLGEPSQEFKSDSN